MPQKPAQEVADRPATVKEVPSAGESKRDTGAALRERPKGEGSEKAGDVPSEKQAKTVPPAEATDEAERAREELERRLLPNLAPVNPDKAEGPSDPNDSYITPKELERRLGPPLVDNADKLVRLDPVYQLWIDSPPRSVVMVGAVCARQVPLELFACLKGSKEHESVVVVYTKAFLVHGALLATGADPGRPVQYQPKYVPAAGPEIEVTLFWKDEKGQRRRARGQEWVRHGDTKKALEYPWVFGGSQFRVNEVTQEREYRADAEGYLICVSNFPSALLDLPVRSSDANDELSFEAFTEHIPPRGTPVTLVLTPKAAKPPKPKVP